MEAVTGGSDRGGTLNGVVMPQVSQEYTETECFHELANSHYIQFTNLNINPLWSTKWKVINRELGWHAC